MRAAQRWWLVVPLVVGMVASASCAARSAVHSYAQRGVDMGRFQRFAWGPTQAQATGDPRLDSNDIMEQRIRASVEKQLATKGLIKSEPANADLLVHAYTRVKQRIDLPDRQPTPCPECKPFIFDEGTFVVDVVDAHNGQVLWRGWSEGSVDGVVGDQRWLEQRIESDVSRMFQRWAR